MDWVLSEVLMPERLGMVYEAPKKPQRWESTQERGAAVTDCI